MSKHRRAHLLFVLVGFVILAAAMLWTVPIKPVPRIPIFTPVEWVYLSDLDWKRATTGWVAVANDGLPSRDLSFAGKPISIGRTEFAKGLGTYPLSEITYDLNGDYLSFKAKVGLDDLVPAGAGGVQFVVFVDEIPLYRSEVIRGNEPPQDVAVTVARAQTLRLVVSDASGGETLNYANWANARLLHRVEGNTGYPGDPAADVIQTQLRLREASRAADRDRATAAAANEIADWQRFVADQGGVGNNGDDSALEAVGSVVRGGYDADRGLLTLWNERLVVELGLEGAYYGKLSLLDLNSSRMTIDEASPVVRIAPGKTLSLDRDSSPISYAFLDVNDPVFGRGKALEARYAITEASLEMGLEMRIEISLFDGAPYALYQMFLSGPGLEQVGGDSSKPIHFKFFSIDSGEFYLGDKLDYVTDYSRIRFGVIQDDDVIRDEAVGFGKPIFLRDRTAQRGLILAVVDETRSPSEFQVVTGFGRVLSGMGLTTQAMSKGDEGANLAVSPRLYLEPTDEDGVPGAFGNFRRIMGELYPSARLPEWVKYQWLSWYVYYMDQNEEAIRSQIDYIAQNLNDLGTWNVLVDAGWYVAEGREDSDWRNVDTDKFPSGLRALVDYAHSKGIKVVLYFSSPYLDSREYEGDWLGLKGLIENHPEWLLLIGEDNERKSFVYDFSNPDFQEYMRAVLRDFFVEYDVDGIKVDGLGNSEGAILERDRLNAFGMVDEVVGQTMDIYRFIYENAQSLKDDVYIESGWLTPVFANSFSHTFRYGDERDSFSGLYPFPGLIEHVDYAAFQKAALEQRPNMGAIRGEPGLSVVNLWWLQASLALGTQSVLSFDLNELTAPLLSEYRALLTHYNAFRGDTRFGDGFEARGESFGPNSFATVTEPYTYLGVINRDDEDRQMTLRLEDFGIQPGSTYVALDVATGRYLMTDGMIDVRLPASSFRLFILRSSPGIIWTNSSFIETTGGRPLTTSGRSLLQFDVSGPATIDGFAEVFVPRPSAVRIDGRELAPAVILQADADHYTYEVNTGILKLKYSHDLPHRITIEY